MTETVGNLWNILITTIPHRHDKLCGLLELIDSQMQPGVSVLVCRDEHLAGYRPGLQALMDAATAEYVSAIADDDLYARMLFPRSWPPWRPARITWVSGRFTENGIRRYPVTNPLACYGWNGCVPSELGYSRPIPPGGVPAGPPLRQPGPPGARAAGAVPGPGLRHPVG